MSEEHQALWQHYGMTLPRLRKSEVTASISSSLIKLYHITSVS